VKSISTDDQSEARKEQPIRIEYFKGETKMDFTNATIITTELLLDKTILLLEKNQKILHQNQDVVIWFV
jgi:hypothetical protein